jgi:hypothetical protein
MLDLQWARDLLAPDEKTAQTNPSPLPPVQAPVSDSDRPSPMPAAPTDAEVASHRPAAPPPVTAPVTTPVTTPVTASQTQPQPGGTNQVVQVMTDPAGATATADSNPDLSCKTPCNLPARTGIHNITVRLDGYQTESREVRVFNQDVELPLVSLRSANGVLMLTSDPTGAEIYLDGRDTGYQTPARISLPAGRHSVLVQKSGVKASDTVEIANGDFRSLKLIAQR